MKGVKVGDSAQLTGALGATVKFLDGFRAGLDYNFYANNYADFALNGSSLVVGGVKTFLGRFLLEVSLILMQAIVSKLVVAKPPCMVTLITCSTKNIL